MSTLSTEATGPQRVTRSLVRFWRFGQWWAELVLDQEADSGALPSGAATVDLPGLALAGTVLRAGLDLPQRPHLVVVGGIGWSSEISRSPTLSYSSDAGVRLSAVLRALSEAAGEPIVQPTDQTLGLHYAIIAATSGAPRRYREALTDLVRMGVIPGWYVDPAGVTRFAARDASEVTVRATPQPARADVGLRVFGIDEPAEFMPGRVVDGIAIERSVIVETPDNLMVECWSR